MNLVDRIEKKINAVSTDTQVQSVGHVVTVADGIATLSGLHDVMAMELVSFANGVQGVALNLEEDIVGVVILGDYTEISEGMEVTRTQQVLSIPVGEDIIGRVVNPRAEAIDGKGKLSGDTQMLLERIAPGVIERKSVSEPVLTGILAIDGLTPVGRGQRQLILGDRQTGKTTIAIDTIINQKGKKMKCVYVAIGQKQSKVMQTVSQLEAAGAMEYTTVVLASASDTPAYLYTAPFAGVAIAEYFMEKGEDVLVVYDDLTKHAAAYRELSLLLKRPPGREAYPGDVFYLHSRLLERACRLDESHGGGSITALPIIETQANDVSTYIPTNVISITDGQIFLESNLFNKGIRPAINVGLSVSRVGGAAQAKPIKKNAGKLKLSLAQYRELESFSQFGSDLDAATKSQLERGRRSIELLKQAPYTPSSVALQVVSLYALNNGFLDTVPIEAVSAWQNAARTYLAGDENASALLASGWDDEIEAATKKIIETVTTKEL